MCHRVTINVTPIRHAVPETKEQTMPENATELLERPAGAGSTAEAAEAEVADITDAEAGEVVAADLLVEEISIDGMCGVY